MPSLLTSPDWYPLRLDLKQHLLTFVRMSPASYRRSSFLDYRAIRSSPEECALNLDDLLLSFRHPTAPRAPLHFILHSAFCCSTLLARYLELVPRCLVLKEPDVLTQLACMRPPFLSPAGLLAPENGAGNWRQLLDLCLRLLARRYCADEVVVIKANDLCNPLGTVLMEHDLETKILFLSIGLRTFLLSVLKSEQRRAWLRERLRFAKRDAARAEKMSNIDPASLSDAQGGAYLWMLNQMFCRRLQTRENNERLLLLDGEHVAERAEETLRIVADFFGLNAQNGGLFRAAAHPIVSAYSKNPSLPYDAERRRRDLAKLEARLLDEVEEGVGWAAENQSRM
jgi:hypothetical protein